MTWRRPSLAPTIDLQMMLVRVLGIGEILELGGFAVLVDVMLVLV